MSREEVVATKRESVTIERYRCAKWFREKLNGQRERMGLHAADDSIIDVLQMGDDAERGCFES
jgi:hypothetical protein